MRDKLEFQADRIEMVLEMHKIPARVTGGTVTPRWIRFQVLPAVGAKISKIKGLSEELAAALDTANCRVARRGGAVDVEIPRDDPQAVRLLPLYSQLDVEEIPALTAVLGLAEDGGPLLIRLPSPDVAHVLVSGTTGSGKTVLLQGMMLSLAMLNGAGELALVVVDPKGSAFRVFEGLPQLVRGVVREVGEAREALGSLAQSCKVFYSGSTMSFKETEPSALNHLSMSRCEMEMEDGRWSVSCLSPCAMFSRDSHLASSSSPSLSRMAVLAAVAVKPIISERGKGHGWDEW